ncbi:molybdenum cofactor sulfurase [Terrihabitans soli]|uniref:Molybdenum cofactor sulfurase n=1 Tax=Terrihabitans soli TaxID=708113 RepID=A0A6S6QVI7_9HYPH|nr:MOSC domain-containing protein [Terrihabitans soli]BCJ91010.1 molybdenum cofactor sulfurase [Terrihabitans soli]
MSEPVVDRIYCGKIAPLGPHGAASGIAKHAVEGPWTVTEFGIVGDHQGDTRVHGGPEKAIHHYPREHYEAWRREEPSIALFGDPPGFGENLSTLGLMEDDVCIGDVFRLGGVILQISQGRQPCWRLNAHSGWPELARRVRATARTGWYYRVLQAGTVDPGSRLALAERLQPDWSVGRVMRVMLAHEIDLNELAGIAEIAELSEGWRQTCRKRIAARRPEDWGKRLDAPT